MVNDDAGNQLLLFFLAAYLISWIIWVPLLLSHIGILGLQFSPGLVLVGRLLGTLGPATAALLMSYRLGGKSSIRVLLGKLRIWRVGWRLYAAATLVYPTLVLITILIYLQLPDSSGFIFQPNSPSTLLVVSIFMVISVLGEEIGWRGFALPLMQSKWSALKSSLLLGAIWTIWHLPFWALLDELTIYGWWYWLLGWAFISSGSIYITWLMNNSGNSLLLIVLFHWSYNILNVALFPITSIIPAYVIFIFLTWVLATAIVIYFGAARLVKKN